jgi:hypothetical protein
MQLKNVILKETFLYLYIITVPGMVLFHFTCDRVYTRLLEDFGTGTVASKRFDRPAHEQKRDTNV